MRVKVNPACTPFRPLSWGLGRGACPEAEIRVPLGPLGASTEKTGKRCWREVAGGVFKTLPSPPPPRQHRTDLRSGKTTR
ncbi:hypothetical protein Mp_zg00060 [Marchantia polymorpha subsp. ruderalis]|uniref:Uncharacterized protein n=1 Tax=Marchantia polymorpha subsp. ruderalis TaxID=1480154 RepID=A0A679DYS1_MARPO|nr:hypothetical protein Mp_zg00060 [Marchantia polymorpha subsp. ruderalis]